MYAGKSNKEKNDLEKKKRMEDAKKRQENIQKNMIEVYEKFQVNMNEFAKKYKKQINSDPKFRQRFSEMCEEFGINPMLAEKNLWTELGFGDFYHQLAMKVLDICAKNRHRNGGIMKIDDIIEYYQKKQKSQVSRNDIIRAVKKLNILGNVSIEDQRYVCTVPIQMNSILSQLLTIADKYGFLSSLILNKQKKWTQAEFQTRIRDLRRKGILWVDKKSHGDKNPHYYFLSHLGTDFQKFAQFMRNY